MELSLEWPSAIISLESLPENLNTELIVSDVDKLSRCELEEKLLDHFDVLYQEESEPFDWFSNEKSVDLPFFESPPSPTFPYKVDVESLATQAYTVPASNYDATIARYHQQQLQPYSSSSSANFYDSIPLPLLYSPPSKHLQSPPPTAVPLAQSSPPVISVSPTPTPIYSSSSSSSSQLNVKIEHCDLSKSSSPPISALLAPFNAEWLKSETLTPPDSPRDEEILKMLEEFEPEALERLMMTPVAGEAFASPAPTPAEVLSCGSPSSYSDDCSSRCSSASPYATSDSGVDDSEWTPSCVAAQQSLARGSRNNSNTSNNNNNNNNNGALVKFTAEDVAAISRRRESKPYSKPGVEERRMRKKEQNKNAATRYRLKKKAEVEEVKLEEHQLIEQNTELKKQLEEVCREVRYLKSLMREVYRKKGLIK